MSKRIVWSVLSCVMALMMLLAACAPAAPPTTVPKGTTPAAPVTPTAPARPSTPVAPATPVLPPSGEPQYGGIITMAFPAFQYYDVYRHDVYTVFTASFIYDKPLMGDWTVNRQTYTFPSGFGDSPIEYMRGQLLESWEMPDSLTIIGHLRKGVRFQNKPPVNGREYVADDFVWSLERIRKSPFTDKRGIEYIASVKARDKYTVEVKLTPPPVVDVVRPIFDHQDGFYIAKETVGKNNEIEDWRNMIGTGPYSLEDFVASSSLMLKKNPDYWGYDELHPKNRLPYADTVKILIMPDRLTEMAALKTGQIDRMMELQWQDAESLKKVNPNLIYKMVPDPRPLIYRPRVDRKPYDDIRVRQAINMSIDRLEMVKNFYGGYATPYTACADPMNGDMFVAYDKLPDKPKWTNISVKELLSYNPERAKKLLAEAGYPNGFKTHIDTNPEWDRFGLTEAFQSYLARIGIQAEMKSYEKPIFDSLRYGFKHEALLLHLLSRTPNPLDTFYWFTGGQRWDFNQAKDPNFDKMFNQASTTFDDKERTRIMTDMDMYIFEQGWSISLPAPQVITAWQPWLKGYQGEGPLGKYNYGVLFSRLWVDQKLKGEKSRR